MIRPPLIKGILLVTSVIGVYTHASSPIAKTETLILSPNKVKEACFDLHKNQQIQFSFKASDPVKFNIHYHNNQDVIYPIGEQLTPEFKPTLFTSNSSQHYCLMWANQQAVSVTLTYTLNSIE
jgi:hypothetical protein